MRIQEYMHIPGASSRPDLTVTATPANTRVVIASLCLCILGSMGITILATCAIVASIGVPIAMITIGYIHLNDCPAERFIPIYLVVGGVFAVFECFVRVYRKFWEESTSTCSSKLSFLTFLLNIGCAIAGCVLVFSVYEPNYSDPSDPRYCNYILYTFAFWLLVSSFILLVAAIIITFCCIGTFYLTRLMRGEEHDPLNLATAHTVPNRYDSLC